VSRTGQSGPLIVLDEPHIERILGPEIRSRYPRKIELDESLGTPGSSFLRARPGGTLRSGRSRSG
jgi:hypothetical protein